jgi:competence protein ComEA
MRTVVAVALAGLLAGAGLAGAQPEARSAAGKATRSEGRININHASKTELMKLDGVGARIAERIIAYREANGPFKRVDDLEKVKGGKLVIEKNADRLAVK